MVDSWYHHSINQTFSAPKLKGALTADVCIIGGGLTGCSAALELAQKGYRVVLLESHSIGWGASGRSGGQFIADYACGHEKMRALVGEEEAKRHFQFSLEAIELIKKRIVEHQISCDLKMGYCSVALKKRQKLELQREQETLLKEYHYPTTYLDQEALQKVLRSPRYLAGLFDENSGHLHPLNYTLGIANAAKKTGADIFEKSEVTHLKTGIKNTVSGKAFSVTADFVVLAGNAYLSGLAPELEKKIMPVGTYIMASEKLTEHEAKQLITNDMCVCDTNFVLDYFRLSADHRLLFGGRVSYSKFTPINLKARLLTHMHRVFPQLHHVRADYAWGGYVDITMNRAPHFGRINPSVYFAQGFSGHGVALTGFAGKIIAQAIQGQSERLDAFAKIPHQSFPGGRWLRTPTLALAMMWFRLRDYL